MAKETKTTTITVKLSPELLEKARQASAETGVSISFVVRKAIEAWVNEGLSKINNQPK